QNFLVNGLPATAKLYRDLVRAVLSACSADPIGVGALATRPDVIGVETGNVRHGGNQHVVAVDVDAVRGSSIPGEVHPLLPLHLVAAPTERDLPGCRSRCCCGGRRRCWCWRWVTARRLDLNRHGRAGLKVTYCCVHTLRRLVRIKPEIIQRAPANRIGVLVLHKGLRAPRYRIGSLSRGPGRAAKPGVVKGAIVCPARMLGWGMKSDVANVGTNSQRHTEGLDSSIQVLVIQSVLIVPDPRDRVRYFVTQKPNPICPRSGLDLAHRRARARPS